MAKKTYEHRPIPVAQSDVTNRTNSRIKTFLELLRTNDDRFKTVRDIEEDSYWSNFNPEGGWVILRDTYTGKPALYYKDASDELHEVPEEYVGSVIKEHHGLNRDWNEATTDYLNNLRKRLTPTVISAAPTDKRSEAIKEYERRGRRAAYEYNQAKVDALKGLDVALKTITPSYYLDKSGLIDDVPVEDAEAIKLETDVAFIPIASGARAGTKALTGLVKKAMTKRAEQALAREAEQALAREAEQAMVKRAEESMAKQALAREGEIVVNRPTNFEDLVMNFSKKGKRRRQSTKTPVETPAKPVETPAKPVETPAKPVETPAKPVETPVETPAKPVETPVETPVEKTPRDYVINTPDGKVFTIPKGTAITIDPDGNYLQYNGFNFGINSDGSINLQSRLRTTSGNMEQIYPGYKVTPNGNLFTFTSDLKIDPTISLWQRMFTHAKDRVPIVKWNTRIPLFKKANTKGSVNETIYRNVSPTITGERGNYTIGVDGNNSAGEYVTEIIPSTQLPMVPMKRTWSPLRTATTAGITYGIGQGLFALGEGWWKSKYPFGYSNTYDTTDENGNPVKWEIYNDPKSGKTFVIDTKGTPYYFENGRPDFSRIVTEFTTDPTGHRRPVDEVNDQRRQVEIDSKLDEQDVQRNDSLLNLREHTIDLSPDQGLTETETEQPKQEKKLNPETETSSPRVNSSFGSSNHASIPLYFKNPRYYV